MINTPETCGPHLLRHLEPRLLETEHRTAVKGGGDFQHGVVVMKTAADVCYRHPLFHHRNPSIHIFTAQDFCGYEVADLSQRRWQVGHTD